MRFAPAFLFAFAAVFTFAALSATGQNARYTPSFEAAPCPKTPEPIEALAHARCGFLIVPENRSKPTGRLVRLAVASGEERELLDPLDPEIALTRSSPEAARRDQTHQRFKIRNNAIHLRPELVDFWRVEDWVSALVVERGDYALPL